MITEERIINHPTNDTYEQGSIKTIEHDETVTIRRPTNHTEISMMENDWQSIKGKIHALSLKKRLNLSAVVFGAMVPYCIDIIADFINNTSPNYFPFIICVILLVLVNFLAKYIPFIGDDQIAENKVHLEDLKKMIAQVDSSFQNK